MNRLLCKKRFLAVLWLCLLFVMPFSWAAEVDLTTAYGLALAQSESLQISVAEWRAAEARYRQALGAMWPEISAKGESRSIHDRDNDTRQAGVGVTWTVFEGFRTVREAEARQAEGLARSYDVKHARLMLYEDVADVFFQIRSFQGQREAAQEQLKALESQAAELERRMKLGRSKRSDLLTTLTQMAETRLTIEQLNQFYAATMELLAFLTGQPASGLQLVDQTPLPAIGEVDRYLMAAADRPDIKADEASVEAARFDMKAAQSERAPKVTVDGNSYPWRKPRAESEWDLVLSFEMPLFDGGRRTARVAEREQQLQISELRLAELQRSSEGDVRMAYQSLFYALRQWSELQAAIGVASDTVTLLQKDYELGRVNNLDVLLSSIQFWRLRQREAALANQLRANMVHLHVAAGKVLP